MCHGTLDHPPTISTLPTWHCYRIKSLYTDPVTKTQTQSDSHTNQSGIARAECTRDAHEATGVGLGWQWNYTDPRDTATDISIRIINPKKKGDAKTYILKNTQPQKIQTIKWKKKF